MHGILQSNVFWSEFSLAAAMWAGGWHRGARAAMATLRLGLLWAVGAAGAAAVKPSTIMTVLIGARPQP